MDFGDAINIPEYDIDYATLEGSKKGYFLHQLAPSHQFIIIA